MLSPHTWAAFLPLISPSFTSLNPFGEFFRPLQPHSTSHNWGICMRIPGTISALVIENAVTRNKPCTRNQFASEWVKKISKGMWSIFVNCGCRWKWRMVIAVNVFFLESFFWKIYNSSILHSKGNQYLVNASQSGLRYSKQIEFQEELMNFLTTWIL